jgi:hypothetical protein
MPLPKVPIDNDSYTFEQWLDVEKPGCTVFEYDEHQNLVGIKILKALAQMVRKFFDLLHTSYIVSIWQDLTAEIYLRSQCKLQEIAR